MLVDTLLDHDVDLDRGQPCFLCGVDALQHPTGAEAAAVHVAEYLVVQGVQADGDPLQARILEGLRFLSQQVSVGGEGEVVQPIDGGELFDQDLELVPEEGFAAGEAYLADAETDEETGHAADLFEGEDVVLGEEAVALAEDLCGHAEGAAEVAPIGDGYAQVPEGPPEEVKDGIGLCCGNVGIHAPWMERPPLPTSILPARVGGVQTGALVG